LGLVHLEAFNEGYTDGPISQLLGGGGIYEDFRARRVGEVNDSFRGIDAREQNAMNKYTAEPISPSQHGGSYLAGEGGGATSLGTQPHLAGGG
jgi:hypothetical protein